MAIRALLLNDCRAPDHWGTQLVFEGVQTRCAAVGIQLAATYRVGHDRWGRAFREKLRNIDLVLVNGEGTCHHDAPAAEAVLRGAASAKAKGLPVVLMNTVWHANPRLNRELRHFDRIFVRESRSAAEVASAGFQPVIVPDLSFSAELPMPADPGSRPPVVMDSVRPDLSFVLASVAAEFGVPFLPMRRWFGRFALQYPGVAVRAAAAHRSLLPAVGPGALERIGQARLLVTGRFHGACLAIALGVPFLAVSSNSHKIDGLCTDLGVPDALIARSDDVPIRSVVDRWLADPERLAYAADRMAEYRTQAITSQMAMLDEIRSLVSS